MTLFWKYMQCEFTLRATEQVTCELWSCNTLLVPMGLFHTRAIDVPLLPFSASSSPCILVEWGNRLPQLYPHIVVYYFFWRCCTSHFKHYQQKIGTYSKDPWQAQLAERVRESRWVGSSFSFTTSTQFQYIQIQKSHSKIARDGDVLHNLTFPCSSASRCTTQRWRTFEQRIWGRK